MSRNRRRARGALLALLGLAAIAASGPVATASGAEFGIAPEGFKVAMLDAEGNPENLAGAHPDRLAIEFALEVEGTGTTARDLIIEMPAGLTGDPSAVPKCPRASYESEEGCPPESQVGVIGFGSQGSKETTFPVFELEPEPGEVLAFGSKSSIQLPFVAELRPDDFGLTFRASDLPSQAVSKGRVEFWGVPADHQKGTAIERRAFLSAPSSCGPVIFTLRVRSWEEGAPWLSESTDTGAPLEECETLGFPPSLALKLSNPVADSPTGLQLDLLTPDNDDPDERANAQVENATIMLPEGITISPGGAQNVAVCSDSQFGLGSAADPSCPASSRVGTAEFDTPALGTAVTGAVYLGEARGAQRVRMLVSAPGPGAAVKFVSSMSTDPATGRLRTSLTGMPQITVSRLSLRLGGGTDSLLASPLNCGTARVLGRFEPYGGGPPVQSTAAIAIAPRLPGPPCPGAPFAPKLTARSWPVTAGRATNFSASLLRQDGELLPRRFAVTLPTGLSTALGSLQPCEGSALEAAQCPADSKVGEVVARAGSGPNPALLRGDTYVTGPYRKAPFGLLMQLRAAIGPFDLGAIAMRAAASVDPNSGRVTVTTDPLPEAVEGIPVRFQSIELSMNRHGLVHNPTSCGPHSVDAAFEASSGASVSASTPFIVRGCRRLPFHPHFQVALTGRHLHRHSKPDMTVEARFPRGQAALRSLELSLPRALGFGVAGLREICSRRDARAGECPVGSRVGTAVTRTPLLSERLRGGLYVVQPEGNGLPDLWVAAAAKGVRVQLRGRTLADHGRLTTKLGGLPDMPLGDMTMRFDGGEGGILSLNSNPCGDGQRQALAATVVAVGQNGARRRLEVPIRIATSCRHARREQ